MQSANAQAVVRFGQPANLTPVVCVVDPKAQDYQGLHELAQANGVRLEICANAEEALRRSRSQSVDLWVVNAKLSGLSGYELCGMLRAQRDRAPVLLITDNYSADAERAAYAAHATWFTCQGLDASVLDAWLADWRVRSRPTSGSAHADTLV